jgi:hypothetical protein
MSCLLVFLATQACTIPFLICLIIRCDSIITLNFNLRHLPFESLILLVHCFLHLPLRRRRILALNPSTVLMVDGSSHLIWRGCPSSAPLLLSALVGAQHHGAIIDSIVTTHHPLSPPITSHCTILLLSLPAPACLHRSHQYLVVASYTRSIV